MTGQEKMVTIGSGIAVLTVALGCLLLAPSFGAAGAAMAVAAAVIIWTAILAAVGWLRLGVNSTIFSVLSVDRAAVVATIRNLLAAARGRTAN
jgi:O-antigen/teichoic acid export membrane protein